MTEAELQLEAEATLTIAIAGVRDGEFSAIMRPFDPEHGWKTVHIPVAIFDSGETKDAFFAGLRGVVAKTGTSAIVLVTDSKAWWPTPKAQGLPPEEHLALLNKHGQDWLVDHGYATKREAFLVLAQTPEIVTLASQFYRRMRDGCVVMEERLPWQTMPQDVFDGRMKMFGAPPSKDVWHASTVAKQ